METYKVCKENDRHKHGYGYEYCTNSDFLLETLNWISRNGWELVTMTSEPTGGWVIVYDANPKD